MARLIVHVEGQTEEQFVNDVLAQHLYQKGFHAVSPRLVGNARLRTGGIKPWSSVREGIVRHLKEDPGRFVTTMVDYYGLPQAKSRVWPGRARAIRLATASQKAQCVQAAMEADIGSPRFIPFVLMHEFEGLLFSDCAALGRAIGSPRLSNRFQAIRDLFETPEEINDSPNTAPSKRILEIMPHWEKPLYGNVAALGIGLDRMRQECPLFDSWLSRLESLVR